MTGRTSKRFKEDYRGKQVVVLGLARSGIAAAGLLSDAGASVVGMDEKASLDESPDLSGVEVILGGFEESVLDGCDEVILSPGVPVRHRFVQEAMRRSIPVISEIELGYRFCRSRIVALTGTNGKSTTVSMIESILKEAGFEAMAAGNVGLPFTSVVSELDENGVFVLEVSSFQLETIKGFHAEIAGILNLTPDHLDRYDSLDDYYRAKIRIVENGCGNDFFFYNRSFQLLLDVAGNFPGATLPFSSTERLDSGAYLDGESLVLAKEGRVTEVMKTDELKVVGLHNVENALAAITAASALGVPAEACRETLRKFTGLPHRMELVAEIDGVSYYNDSKATNLEATLMSLRGVDVPVILIAGGRDKGGDFVKLQKESSKLKAVVTLGEAAPLIEEALEKVVPTVRSETMQEAVERAAGIADSGQMVLLSPACASFDMFENFEHRGEIFKECVFNLRGKVDGRQGKDK